MSVMSFRKHECELGLGAGAAPGARGDWRRWLCAVSARHPAARRRFHSQPAVAAERQRHELEGGSLVLHPHSVGSMARAAAMACVDVAHACTSTFRLSYVLVPRPDGAHGLHPVDWLMLALHALCWLDIVLRFNTGYEAGDKAHVVLDRTMIAR